MSNSGDWPPIWAKVAASVQFEHVGGLAADMSKSLLRGLSLGIFVGWLRIWAKVASAQVEHFVGVAKGMGKRDLTRLILRFCMS